MEKDGNTKNKKDNINTICRKCGRDKYISKVNENLTGCVVHCPSCKHRLARFE